MTEDWHARMRLMRVSTSLGRYEIYVVLLCYVYRLVIWKQLFSNKSSTNMGTLYQLNNLLNRTTMDVTPSSVDNVGKDVTVTQLSCTGSLGS